MSENVACDKRAKAKPRVQLDKEEVYARQDLLKHLRNTKIVSSDDPNVIKKEITDVKEGVDKFSEASKALSTWLRKNGLVEQLGIVRKNRVTLAHDEVPAYIDELNGRLETLGEDKLSNIEISSQTTVHGGVPKGPKSVTSQVSRVNEESSSVLGSGSANRGNQSADRVLLSHRDGERPIINGYPEPNDNLDGSEVFGSESQGSVPADLGDRTDEWVSDQTHYLGAPSGGNQPRLDIATRRLLRNDLMSGVGDAKFDGSPELYWSWQYQINLRMSDAELSSYDAILAINPKRGK